MKKGYKTLLAEANAEIARLHARIAELEAQSPEKENA